MSARSLAAAATCTQVQTLVRLQQSSSRYTVWEASAVGVSSYGFLNSSAEAACNHQAGMWVSQYTLHTILATVKSIHWMHVLDLNASLLSTDHQ